MRRCNCCRACCRHGGCGTDPVRGCSSSRASGCRGGCGTGAQHGCSRCRADGACSRHTSDPRDWPQDDDTSQSRMLRSLSCKKMLSACWFRKQSKLPASRRCQSRFELTTGGKRRRLPQLPIPVLSQLPLLATLFSNQACCTSGLRVRPLYDLTPGA